MNVKIMGESAHDIGTGVRGRDMGIEVGTGKEIGGRRNENATTVEPLTNGHPHQRPSLSYDHISCDGQWFLFVYESLTSDHPSYMTTPM